MKFLKKSSDIGIYRLLQCLIKGNSIKESGITISFEERDLTDEEILLIINIDIDKNHLKCLKQFVALDKGIAIPDLLLVYASYNNGNILTKFFIVDLGPHKESELTKKEQGARILFEKLDIQIKKFKFFNVIKGSSHGKHKKYRAIRPGDLLKEIRKSG